MSVRKPSNPGQTAKVVSIQGHKGVAAGQRQAAASPETADAPNPANVSREEAVWPVAGLSSARQCSHWLDHEIHLKPYEGLMRAMWWQEPEMLVQAERLVNTITPQWPGPQGTPLASLAIRAAGEKLLEVVNDGEDYTQRIVGAYLFGLLSITDHVAHTTVRGVDKTDMVRQWTPFSMPLRVWASKNGIRELRVATTPSRPSSWLMGVRGYAVGQIADPREIGFLNKHAPRG